MESDFYKKVHQLECQFATQLQELNERRQEIVSGMHEPTDDEADYDLVFKMEHLAPESKEKLQMHNDDPPDDLSPPGVPDFWLTVLKHHKTACDMIQEQDEPILKHLTDITLDIFNDPMFYRLNFHFEPNEWFSNEVLIKEYTLKCEPDLTFPCEFEGTEIVACKGCKIDWKQGKDVTQKLQEKEVIKKGKTHFVMKMVKTDSFFNFFDPPPANKQGLLDEDYKMGKQFREHIVPRAVFYFTGEATLDDSFEAMDVGDYDFDEDEDEEEEIEDEKEVTEALHYYSRACAMDAAAKKFGVQLKMKISKKKKIFSTSDREAVGAGREAPGVANVGREAPNGAGRVAPGFVKAQYQGGPGGQAPPRG